MTPKTNNNNNNKNKKATPSKSVTLQDLKQVLKPVLKQALIAGGEAAGSLAPIPFGREVGGYLGAKLSKLIGSGDYVQNALVKGNSLMMPMALSKNNSNHQTIRVQHREYITDLKSSSATAFNTQVVNVNPADYNTFPWLSNLASNFEQYRIHGMAFEFVSSTSEFYQNSAMGTIMMGAQYDINSPLYASKRIMENSDDVISFRPDKCAVYGLECEGQALGKYTTREAGIPPSPFTDFVKFVVGYNTPITSTLGELWAVYDIELYRPIITNTLIAPVDTYLHAQQMISDISWSTVGATVFTPVTANGLNLSVTQTVAKNLFMNISGCAPLDVYKIDFFLNKATAASASAYSVNTFVNCTSVLGSSTTFGYASLPDVTVNGTFAGLTFYVQATSTDFTFTVGNGNGAYNGRCDLWVTRISNPGIAVSTI